MQFTVVTIVAGFAALASAQGVTLNDTTNSTAPYSNGTSPVVLISNGTTTTLPCTTSTAGATIPGATVPETGGYPAATGNASSSTTPVPYTGAASTGQMVGAGAVVGFGAVFAALGMM
ncbi:hypothetical protein LTR08_000158 [Meristemomyces frigidus]|nr:hypothetical protein LTR08_000158 [Meristemomyces frigidus]